LEVKKTRKGLTIKDVIDDYKNILNYMEQDRTDEIKMFMWKTRKIDNVRNEDVFKIFPELKDIA
jgi:hypothetical protein